MNQLSVIVEIKLNSIEVIELTLMKSIAPKALRPQDIASEGHCSRRELRRRHCVRRTLLPKGIAPQA